MNLIIDSIPQLLTLNNIAKKIIKDNYIASFFEDRKTSIHKIDKSSDDKEDNVDTYKFQFKFMDEIETFESDTIKNVHFFIGDHIAKILDKKLKNK